VLRAPGPGADRLLDHVATSPGARRLRVVSNVVRTKGKRELFLCGEFAPKGGGDAVAPAALPPATGWARAVRLDRDETAANAAWNDLRRGDIVVLSPGLELERPRVGPGTHVAAAPIETLTGVTSLD
jgi:hypothetical protein